MNRVLFKIWQLLILLQRIKNSTEIKFDFLFEDERIVSDCGEKPAGTLGINSLFDFTNTGFDMSEDGVTVSGYTTVIWDIQPTDRVEIAVSVQYYDRGSWQPTILNMVIKDFCKVMFDEKQMWYDCYSKHILNAAEVNQTCYNVKGSQIKFETYTIHPVFSSGMSLKSGRHSMRFIHSAYDQNGVVRPNKICFEVKGEFKKSSQ
ncbi:hypothetical protein KR084_007539 [Drosophila pseudotakahashii]|nr:hypothetical protein KR084_007539 [Drosophila pseudotakahashii]